MTQEEIIKASTDPQFLGFLEIKEKDAIESKDIKVLYEVLDSLLILDLHEERIHTVYGAILSAAFTGIEQRMKESQKLTLEGNDLYFVRAFYEHSIEKWSNNDFKGAKELFFILSQIIEDELVKDAIVIKLLACSNSVDMDDFYDNMIDHKQNARDEKYAYFLLDFTVDKKEHINENAEVLARLHEELKPLLEV